MIRGPIRIDLCYHRTNDAYADFDSETGNYTFMTTNRDSYPPGKYVFNVYGTSGGMTASIRFTMILADHPCSRV